MSKRRSTKELLKQATEAHTDLNVFYGVISLMEGGLLGPDSYEDAERIIAICKSTSQKCLRRYDKAVAALDDRGDGG
jgi:hypothetical protein